jgi:glutamyl-tRNA reductase
MTIGFDGGPQTRLRPTADTLVTALRARAEEIRRAELARAEARWETRSSADLRRLKGMTADLVDALVAELTGRLGHTWGDEPAHLESACYLLGLAREPDA